MATPVRDKHYLKSLHEEIALFDRKLAHLQRYEAFPSERDRNAAAAKMSVKRGQLVQTARKLAEEGIEFQPNDLPRSMHPEGFVPEAPAPKAVPTDQAAVVPAELQEPVGAISRLTASPFRNEILEYIAKRKSVRQN